MNTLRAFVQFPRSPASGGRSSWLWVADSVPSCLASSSGLPRTAHGPSHIPVVRQCPGRFPRFRSGFVPGRPVPPRFDVGLTFRFRRFIVPDLVPDLVPRKYRISTRIYGTPPSGSTPLLWRTSPQAARLGGMEAWHPEPRRPWLSRPSCLEDLDRFRTNL